MMGILKRSGREVSHNPFDEALNLAEVEERTDGVDTRTPGGMPRIPVSIASALIIYMKSLTSRVAVYTYS